MEIDWNAIIWFVIWAVVIVASLGIIAWIIVATFAAKQYKRVRDEITSPTSDPFDTPFFRNHR